MKVLLNENIENLGRIGDMIDVKPGYARNYLFPKKLALAPNKHNLEIMKYKKAKAEKQLEQEKLSARGLKEKLEEVTLVIEKKAGETDTLFGSVTAMEIEYKLAELGFEIERKKFHLDEPIKKLGNYVCKIKLVEEIEADVKIEVIREGGEEEKAETAEAVTAEEPVEEETIVEEVEEVTEEVEESEEEPEEAPAEESEEEKTEE